jgi:ribosomal protein L11 methyltransferase
VSWRVTIPCTRAQGEAVADADDLFAGAANPPVIVSDEPDAAKPDAWLIHAYFEHPPTAEELGTLVALGTGEPHVEQLGEADWVTMSQAGLQPIRAGRFYVHTPMYRSVPPGTIPFEIDASLAFGTGTGLLAFAALALWPDAKCIATDIDPVAIDVARDNAAINRVTLGHGTGELLLGVADGMDSPLLAARAPFDLIIANILAGPLIELAPDFARALSTGGAIVLAGILDTQADSVAAAYQAKGLAFRERGAGEWPVLVLGG